MNCFQHENNEAVGVCRYCFKGCCRECAVDFGDGIACKNSCVEKAKAVVSLIELNLAAKERMKSGSIMFPSFMVILGVLFAGYGIYCGGIFGFNTATGVVFMAFGVVTYLYQRKIIAKSEKNA